MIKLSKPYFDKKEIEAIQESLDSGWVAGQGPQNNKLAELISDYCGTKYAVPVNNCTAGLHLALLTLNIGHNDEVLVSDFTYPATGHSVLYCGAKPRFVDVKPDTYNINPELIEPMINKNTKAILVVHALGQMAEMDRISEIAKARNLFIIEDAACSLGSEYNGLSAGSYGDITAFSFHARKNVTSGEGGIVITNNENYAKHMSSLSCFGMESAFDRQTEFNIPVFKLLGYNYKLSDINAAVAIQQLLKYSAILEKRMKQVALYNELLANHELIQIPVEHAKAKHVYQTYAIKLNERINRNKLIMDLKKDDIQTQIGTYASHIQPVYQSIDKCPVSLSLYNSTLALPLYHELKDSEIHFVVEKLLTHINSY
jgi:perosamine synthetase